MRKVAAQFSLFLALSSVALADTGEIQSFVRLPVQTFDWSGSPTEHYLEEALLPPLSKISTDGFWPDKQLLLVSLRRRSYFIPFASVVMNDQKEWKKLMAMHGGPFCRDGNEATRQGTAQQEPSEPKTIIAGGVAYAMPSGLQTNCTD